MRKIAIIVFELRERLGGGLAYDTSDAVHRIHVPAVKMSLHSGDPEEVAAALGRGGSAESAA